VTTLGTPVGKIKDVAIFLAEHKDGYHDAKGEYHMTWNGEPMRVTDYCLDYDEANRIQADFHNAWWIYRKEAGFPSPWKSDWIVWAQHRQLVCTLCGEKYRHSYFDCEELRVMVRFKVCFGCACWMSRAIGVRQVWHNDPYRLFRSDNWQLYNIVPLTRSIPDIAKGYAGAEFRIQFPDGTVKVTDNLWDAGSIPLRLQKYFQFLPLGEFLRYEPGYNYLTIRTTS
jgi:hypothetical protein